jgi:eukaryotic translation initiation factor 2C
VHAKRFKVEIGYVAKVQMSPIAQVLGAGQESEYSQEAIQVLDIILRQHSARQYVVFIKQPPDLLPIVVNHLMTCP